MKDILKALEQQLTNWNPQWLPAEGAGKLPHLAVDVTGITGFIAQVSTAQKLSGKSGLRDGVDALQMYFEMPFEMNPQYYDETAMLLSDINQRIPVLAFIANPQTRTVAFRHMHLFAPDDPAYLLMDEALQNIAFIFNLYLDAIQSVASGAKSYELVAPTLP